MPAGDAETDGVATAAKLETGLLEAAMVLLAVTAGEADAAPLERVLFPVPLTGAGLAWEGS